MFELKPLTKDAVPAALDKAERYRLLNEPAEAESICLDVLEIEPDNQPALVMLLLALTDQFADDLGRSSRQAEDILPRLAGEYDRLYYAGIISERQAKALASRNVPGTAGQAYEGFLAAMRWYEKAEALRPAGNDDARLRWNRCARFLQRHPHLAPGPEERVEQPLE
jgi:hypothetical protein